MVLVASAALVGRLWLHRRHLHATQRIRILFDIKDVQSRYLGIKDLGPKSNNGYGSFQKSGAPIIDLKQYGSH